MVVYHFYRHGHRQCFSATTATTATTATADASRHVPNQPVPERLAPDIRPAATPTAGPVA
jgi:hypothetical protein